MIEHLCISTDDNATKSRAVFYDYARYHVIFETGTDVTLLNNRKFLKRVNNNKENTLVILQSKPHLYRGC